MRCRMLVAVVVWAAAAQADDPVQEAAAKVYAAVRDDAQLTLQQLAKQDHPDPWLIDEDLCSLGAHDAAAAFAAAVQDAKLAAYVESRRGKKPDSEVRRAVRAAHLLRIANGAREASRILKHVETPDDPVLAIRLHAARAKTLRDLGQHADSERCFLAAGKLAHSLGWRRGATESLRYLAYWHCFGAKGASEMWSIRRKLEPGEAAVVYGRPVKDLLAAVVTAERTWYVPLGALAPIQAALAEFKTPRAGVPVLADELHARLVAPLGLGKNIERVFIVPIQPLIDLPWVLLLGSREVVLGRDGVKVAAFGDRVLAVGERDEGDYGEGVLAVGLPRREGGTAAGQEAHAVGDSVLVGEQATWEAIEEAAAARPRLRALHVACPSRLAKQWFRPYSGLGMRSDFWRQGQAWLPEGEPELVVLSVDESLRLVHAPEGRRGPALRAPRVIVSLWDVDPEATRALMRRFHALWNGRVSLPACTALKLAQDFVRSHEVWKHPYYWAGWQLWASPPREGGS